MITRRDFIKKGAAGTAGMALMGALKSPVFGVQSNPSDVVGIGFIGVGRRGTGILTETLEVPGTEVRGICDIYSVHLENAMKMVNNPRTKSYGDYRRLLENKDIDAVVIGTPDHLHAKMTIAAAEAGKDVYVEKCMVRTFDEIKPVINAIKNNKRVFQLGHQGRSSSLNVKAKEVYDSGILGKVNLVRMTRLTNGEECDILRYKGGYRYSIPPDSHEKNIDWNKFLGDAPKRAFDMKRFFHWRLYWDYCIGYTGDLFSHSYDQINQIMELGIPETCSTSGGTYYYKDGRETQDLLNVNLDYPQKEVSVVFSGGYNNGYNGSTMQVLGKNGTLAEGGGGGLDVFLEPYKAENGEKIEKARKEKISKGEKIGARDKVPVSSYTKDNVEEVTGHVQDFVDCIRTRGKTRCNEEIAFQEAVTCMMTDRSFKEKRQVKWNPVKEEIV